MAPDLVAWITPLDGTLKTLVLREGLTVSSAPSADHVVAAGPGCPLRGVFRLLQGTWTVSLDGASPSALVDNQRFAVGATEFVFKTARPVKAHGDSGAWLEVIGGVDKDRRIPLRKDRPCSLGRDSSCTAVIRGEGVGPRHLLARLNDGCCELDDLGCEGGVRFAGGPVGHVALCPGQEVAVGSIRLVFRQSGWGGR